MSKVIGNINGLYSMHGAISNKKKLQEALEFMSQAEELNIDELNKTSELGGIYITDNGRILDTFSAVDEKFAKYKMVPTGLNLRYTDTPLFASFIKLNNFWEGAFIGTATQLFIMYREHYNGKNWNYEHEKEIISNSKFNINGFGLDSILSLEKEEIEYNNTEGSVLVDLEKAINKAMKQSESKTASKSTKAKAAKKAEKLKAHLEKVKVNQEKKEAREKREQEEKLAKQCEDNTDDVNWLDVMPMEETRENIEDTASTELENKLDNFLNDESQFCELDNPSDYTVIQPFVNKELADKVDLREHAAELLKSMDNDYDHPENETFNSQINSAVVQEIYDNLLVKEQWMASKRNRLAFYLKGLFIVIDYHRIKNGNNHRGNGYVYSENNEKCVVNTGLLDIYGNYIYLVDHTPKTAEFMDKTVSIMKSKLSLIQMGFSIADVKNLPDTAKFVENQSELLFDGNIEDFDFDDTEHLYHIIQERIHRFPEKFRTEPANSICDRIKNAVSRAIKMSKTDYRYILPKYDFYRHQIQFLIPFHLETSLDECPELVIVVGKYKGVWGVYTVLPTIHAYDDARLICNPNNSWIKKTCK